MLNVPIIILLSSRLNQIALLKDVVIKNSGSLAKRCFSKGLIKGQESRLGLHSFKFEECQGRKRATLK